MSQHRIAINVVGLFLAGVVVGICIAVIVMHLFL
jgi:hypothetical protein